METAYDIKFVAVYLRKSRAEQENELEKHRTILTDLCNRNNFKYVEYAEIGTSDSIDMRPKMTQLLKDVDSGLYDAVCVVDYDRLGRGDLGEQDRIKKAFQKSSTLIITPEKIYDLNNDLDDTYADFKGLFARQEYKMITKRLRQGKKIGARRGDWTNGTPSFPYEYERYEGKYNQKGLVVNDELYKVYREIISMAIDGMSPNKISITLNQRGITTKKGNNWSGATIQRLLLDETQLGKIISNKSKGDGHKNRKPNAIKLRLLPREEWIIVENCHEAVKTQYEHDIISKLIKSRNLNPNRAMPQTYSFSGIVRCGKCGRCMTFGKDLRNKYRLIMKSCVRQDHVGNKCKNGGIWVSEFEQMVLNEIQSFLDNYAIQEAEMSVVNSDLLNKVINEKEVQKEKYIKALDVVDDGYELGDYSRDVWLNKKQKWNEKIRKVESDIVELKYQLNSIPKISYEIRQQNIEKFFNNIEQVTTPKERNDLYRTIIERIIWIKDGDAIKIEIVYK
ncbi:MAG: recombinase family protein [Oscillospiraceae bacterium]|nr:recombinase family protein [Oscillospiraceae bacterium]